MRICAAQISSQKGALQVNMERHLMAIDMALDSGAEAIFFPELSLTGYEPGLASDLAINSDDSRLGALQQYSVNNEVVIGVGAPLRKEGGICISMLVFHPTRPLQVYSKKYLHRDEKSFFIPGSSNSEMIAMTLRIAPAICYEISVDAHARAAHRHGADVYLASVAKFQTGIDKALDRLAYIAQRYRMITIMANAVGEADGQPCAGRSSIWNDEGRLLAQLDNRNEGIMILDTSSGEVISRVI
jgi:predicted amidohydrolase